MRAIYPITPTTRNSPAVAKNSSFTYEADLADESNAIISGLTALTLEIVDTDTGNSILAETDILNADRGIYDVDTGHVIISLNTDDTNISVPQSVKRSLKLKWIYFGKTGRHQYDFWIVPLAGDP